MRCLERPTSANLAGKDYQPSTSPCTRKFRVSPFLSSGCGPDGNAIAIPKVDGTPLLWVSASFGVTSCGVWVVDLQGLDILRIGFRGGSLSLSSVWVTGCRRLKLGFPLHMTSRRVFSSAGGDQLHVLVADVIKSFDTVDIFWTVLSGVLACHPGLGRSISPTMTMVRLRFQQVAGLREPWCRDGGECEWNDASH